MPFPATYDKQGKTAKDFFGKNFQDKKNVTLVSNADDGNVKFETEISVAKGNTFAGNFKVNNKLDLPGELEVELDTAGKVKGTFKHDKIADGAKLKLVATEKQNLETTVDYAKDAFNTTISINASKEKTFANVAGVVGYDGLSVGVIGQYDFKKGALSDYNAATQYEGKDFVAAVRTESKADQITASYHHAMSNDIKLAARFKYNIATPSSRSVEFGAHFDLDKDSSARVKGDSNGNIETVFKQRFWNPSLKYSLGFKFDANSKSTTPTNFGVGFEFGK